MLASTTVLAFAIFTGCARQPSASDDAVMSSGSGKGAIMRTVQVSAQVVAIDLRTRALTLKGPDGKVVDIVAGREIRNLDQIQTGDRVVVR